MSEPLWDALAEALRARREELRLPMDLRPFGGPTDMTVRKLERAQPTRLQAPTKRQLETALQLPAGAVDSILAGRPVPQQERFVAPGYGDEPLTGPGHPTASEVRAAQILSDAAAELLELEMTGRMHEAVRAVMAAARRVRGVRPPRPPVTPAE